MNRARSQAVRALIATILAFLARQALALDARSLSAQLTPEPQQLVIQEGKFPLRDGPTSVALPTGPAHDACRTVLQESLQAAGVTTRTTDATGDSFRLGQDVPLPELPREGVATEAYVLSISPSGVAARGASSAGLLYAAQTLRQLLRLSSEAGRLPCLTITDYPEFRVRGIYIEGGQERFGRLVTRDYLLEQIRRLAEFKMNTLVLECYNLLPYASFPACADAGTLSADDCRAIIAEAKRFHVTLTPSLQTLAQAYELVWTCEAGTPYREATAPGMICPSNPDVYPFIRGLYRDLLTWFDQSPVIGVGCSEIDMQWQGRYCTACRKRVDAGETVRDLLLGHAVRCIEAVHTVSADLGRPVRPLIWADEFYMYGPGKDWVGIERISKDTVMGYWKYWPDYAGIGGLLERGYDVLGISAMYNHCFYLADLSPADPPKQWPPMEQTGVRNIADMLREAHSANTRTGTSNRFWGAATASFSKHRLRAFDSIWYGFLLNGHAGWSRSDRPLDDYQDAFTRAFARQYHDARTDAAADALARAYNVLDRCKSRLEAANQKLNDVVGVYDTQEPGYPGNTLMAAFRRCGRMTAPDGTPSEDLGRIREAAAAVVEETGSLNGLLDRIEPHVAGKAQLADLGNAAEAIAAHAERQRLMIDTQIALVRSEAGPAVDAAQTRDLATRWARHRERLVDIERQSRRLYQSGDPLGHRSLLSDVAAIESHLARVAGSDANTLQVAPQTVLLEEAFATLDATRWIVLGLPRVLDGHMETRAPGGWDKYCGIATRNAVPLQNDRPLVVELELTPLVMGVDSQLICAATESGGVSYQFSLSGSANHFDLHTQSSRPLEDRWSSPETGWKRRAFSPAIAVNTTYGLRLEITRRTWRVVLREHGQGRLQPPLWDSGPVPMDELTSTRLLFADVEPENSTGATRWGPIRIWQAGSPR